MSNRSNNNLASQSDGLFENGEQYNMTGDIWANLTPRLSTLITGKKGETTT